MNVPSPDSPRPRPALLRYAGVILGAALAAAVLLAAFATVRQIAADRLVAQAQSGAEAKVQTLESILATQRAVAAILSDDTLVVSALNSPSDSNRAAVSRKLERLRDQTQSAVIYLLDGHGVALAASN